MRRTSAVLCRLAHSTNSVTASRTPAQLRPRPLGQLHWPHQPQPDHHHRYPTPPPHRRLSDDSAERRALADAIAGLGGNPINAYVNRSRPSSGILAPADMDAMLALPMAELVAAHPPAQLTVLANALSKGIELQQDEVRAVEIWTAATEAGDETAAHRLAMAQYTGRGMAADPDVGLATLEAMAEAGHAPSMYVTAKILQQKAEVRGWPYHACAYC